MYDNANHSTERVIRGDAADGPDSDTKGKSSQPINGYAVQPTLLEKIREAQSGDLKLQEFREQVEAGLRSDMQIHADGTLRFGNRICVPKGGSARSISSSL